MKKLILISLAFMLCMINAKSQEIFRNGLTSYKDVNVLYGGKLNANGGIVFPTASTHIWATGGNVLATDTAGTNTVTVAATRYWVEVMIPYNVTLTGLSYYIGNTGATDSVVVQLCNSSGVQVATSRSVGGVAAIIGTANTIQSVPFTSTYYARAGLYYAVVQTNGTTARIRTYHFPTGMKMIAGSATGVWQTKADITPGTTYTDNKGPIIMTY